MRRDVAVARITFVLVGGVYLILTFRKLAAPDTGSLGGVLWVFLGCIAIAPLVPALSGSFRRWIGIGLSLSVLFAQGWAILTYVLSSHSTAGWWLLVADLAGGCLWVVARGLDDVLAVKDQGAPSPVATSFRLRRMSDRVVVDIARIVLMLLGVAILGLFVFLISTDFAVICPDQDSGYKSVAEAKAWITGCRSPWVPGSSVITTVSGDRVQFDVRWLGLPDAVDTATRNGTTWDWSGSHNEEAADKAQLVTGAALVLLIAFVGFWLTGPRHADRGTFMLYSLDKRRNIEAPEPPEGSTASTPPHLQPDRDTA